MEGLALIQTPVRKMGKDTLFLIRELGRIAIFFMKGMLHIFTWPFQFRKLLEQLYFIGMKSVVVVALTGAFTGMVLGFQGYYTLVK